MPVLSTSQVDIASRRNVAHRVRSLDERHRGRQREPYRRPVQLRRHIHHGFTVGDQPLGDVTADAGASFDGPKPVRVPTAGGQHRLVAVAVGGESAPAYRLFAIVDDLDSGGTTG
jgi:hypothetical protein